MIKIIFSDMDGTLLTSENKLPEGFDEMIAELKRRDVLFAPASGRQYASLLKSFEKYRDEFLFVAEGGTLVMYRGKEIFSHAMEVETVKKVLAAGATFNDVMCVWCGKNDSYILREFNQPRYTDGMDKYYTHRIPVDSWDEITDTPIKVALYDPTGNAKKNIYDKLAAFYDSLQVVQTIDWWVDVSSPGANKGEAIENVQRVLNVKPEECAAFGDYMNDCEMLQAVGYGFAMANAHPDLKKFAKFETLSCDEGGVLVGIRKLMADGLI